LRERISRRLHDLGISASKASLKAKLNRNAVSDILSTAKGGNKNPTIETLIAIAVALECDLEFLLGRQDAPRQGDDFRPVTGKIPIAGTVEAGAFRIMSSPEPWLEEHDFDFIEAPRSLLFPQAKHFAFRVRGDSMNASKPRPIMDGEIGLFVDLVDTGQPVLDNKIYLVRRTHDAGQTFEWTLKRARLFRDRIELTPESTNPIHKPLVLRPEANHGGIEVTAIGLLYAMHYSFE
jgi:SOS-response transcriptional repressor LexA